MVLVSGGLAHLGDMGGGGRTQERTFLVCGLAPLGGRTQERTFLVCGLALLGGRTQERTFLVCGLAPLGVGRRSELF